MQHRIERGRAVTKAAALIRFLDLQLAFPGPNDCRRSRRVRHQNPGRVETQLSMSSKEGNGFLDRRARFEQLAVPDRGRQFGIWLPCFFRACDPVGRETFGIHSSLRKPIIKAHINAAVALGVGRNEPNSGPGIGPVFIIAEQNPIFVGEHKDGARVNGRGNKREDCEDHCKLHGDRLRRVFVVSPHECRVYPHNFFNSFPFGMTRLCGRPHRIRFG